MLAIIATCALAATLCVGLGALPMGQEAVRRTRAGLAALFVLTLLSACDTADNVTGGTPTTNSTNAARPDCPPADRSHPAERPPDCP